MKSIFEFAYYRAFLAHYYEEKKKTTTWFSYRYFAEKAGVNSSSFLKDIMIGRRNLTPAMTEKFCAALGLTMQDSVYFSSLVLFNQAKTAREKQMHYAVVRALIRNIREVASREEHFGYFDAWYTPLIHELICSRNFNGDHAKLGAALSPLKFFFRRN